MERWPDRGDQRGGGGAACGPRAESLRTKDEDGGLDRPTTQLGWAEPDVPWARARDGLEISSPYKYKHTFISR